MRIEAAKAYPTEPGAWQPSFSLPTPQNGRPAGPSLHRRPRVQPGRPLAADAQAAQREAWVWRPPHHRAPRPSRWHGRPRLPAAALPLAGSVSQPGCARPQVGYLIPGPHPQQRVIPGFQKLPIPTHTVYMAPNSAQDPAILAMLCEEGHLRVEVRPLWASLLAQSRLLALPPSKQAAGSASAAQSPPASPLPAPRRFTTR